MSTVSVMFGTSHDQTAEIKGRRTDGCDVQRVVADVIHLN